MEWVWLWLAFVFLLLVLPLAYGWGYRGWGAPPPPYRRRAVTPEEADRRLEAEAAGEDEAWGALAVFVWLSFTIAVVWMLVALVA